MIIFFNIFSLVLIFAAGVLLATRVLSKLFLSPDVTGHEHIDKLRKISEELSNKEMNDPDIVFLKIKIVEAISSITNSLIDNKAIVADTHSRTRWGLILMATGTFVQGFLLFLKTQ